MNERDFLGPFVSMLSLAGLFLVYPLEHHMRGHLAGLTLLCFIAAVIGVARLVHWNPRASGEPARRTE